MVVGLLVFTKTIVGFAEFLLLQPHKSVATKVNKKAFRSIIINVEYLKVHIKDITLK